MSITAIAAMSLCSGLIGLGAARLLHKARTVADLERSAEAREMTLVAITAAEQRRRESKD